MLTLGGLSVALALVLVPGSTEALKEGECEGRFSKLKVALAFASVLFTSY